MNAKAKGSKRELKSMRLLEAAGYSVTQSGASLGLRDLIHVWKDYARQVVKEL